MTQSSIENGLSGGCMSARSFGSMAMAGIVFGVLALSEPGIAQTPASVKSTGQVKTYRAPRTTDGQPDLQGFWSNTTYTPLQRPNGVTKAFFTKEEAEEII